MIAISAVGSCTLFSAILGDTYVLYYTREGGTKYVQIERQLHLIEFAAELFRKDRVNGARPASVFRDKNI